MLLYAADKAEKHPHTRGEYTSALWADSGRLETPPHTWGILAPVGDPLAPRGNTPTHVGNTGLGQQCATPKEKHPHTRGEYARKDEPPSAYSETPPHTWGIPHPYCCTQ